MNRSASFGNTTSSKIAQSGNATRATAPAISVVVLAESRSRATYAA
jgi:hypothetical protein